MATCAVVAGNAIETYDFLVYIYFATYIGRSCFPGIGAGAGWLQALAGFAGGFVLRPLGAAVLGRYADRRGSKPALLLSMTLTTLGTMALAFAPTFGSVGVLAPIVVVAARLVQGFGFGGDFGPSCALLIDQAKPARGALQVSWQYASQGIGALVAGLAGLAVTMTLTEAQVASWGWRLPFGVSMVLLPLAALLRSRMRELGPAQDPIESRGSSSQGRAHAPVGSNVLWSIALMAGSAVTTYALTYFTPHSLAVLNLPGNVAMSSAIALGAAMFVFSLLGGRLGDLCDRRGLALATRVTCMVLIFPAFSILHARPGTPAIIAVTCLLCALNAISSAATLMLILQSFPATRRAYGSALAYGVGLALFGGATPYLLAQITMRWDEPLAPAWYVCGCSLLSVVALLRTSLPARDVSLANSINRRPANQ